MFALGLEPLCNHSTLSTGPPVLAGFVVRFIEMLIAELRKAPAVARLNSSLFFLRHRACANGQISSRRNAHADKKDVANRYHGVDLGANYKS